MVRLQAPVLIAFATSAVAFAPATRTGSLFARLRPASMKCKTIVVAREHQRRPGRRGLPRFAMAADDERSMISAGGINVSGEAPFEIRGFSLGTAFLAAGVLLTVASFAEYFNNGGAGLSGLGFVYGIPVALVGLALKYAELAPVPCQSTSAAEALFEEKATETLRKIKNDVTRHRYGDEAHLDSTIKSLGLVVPQQDYPQLQYLTQSVEADGRLAFSMVFQSKATPYKMWVDPKRVAKYNSFFGPGVDASVVKVSAEDRLVAIKLVVGELPATAATAAPAEVTPAEAAPAEAEASA